MLKRISMNANEKMLAGNPDADANYADASYADADLDAIYFGYRVC